MMRLTNEKFNEQAMKLLLGFKVTIDLAGYYSWGRYICRFPNSEDFEVAVRGMTGKYHEYVDNKPLIKVDLKKYKCIAEVDKVQIVHVNNDYKFRLFLKYHSKLEDKNGKAS